MARKKKDDPVAELLTALLIGVICGAYYMTKSISTTVVIGIALFIFILIVQNTIRMQKESKIRASGIREVDKMTGVQFEEYLRILFSSTGYRVLTTPTTGDFGADLILEKNDKRIAVQAKRNKSNVGIKAVQEVAGAKKHYKANETWVVTNSNFTKAAEELAKSNDVVLFGRERLIAYTLKAKSAKDDRAKKTTTPA